MHFCGTKDDNGLHRLDLITALHRTVRRYNRYEQKKAMFGLRDSEPISAWIRASHGLDCGD